MINVRTAKPGDLYRRKNSEDLWALAAMWTDPVVIFRNTKTHQETTPLGIMALTANEFERLSPEEESAATPQGAIAHTSATEMGKLLARLSPDPEDWHDGVGSEVTGMHSAGDAYLALIGKDNELLLVDGSFNAEQLIELGMWLKERNAKRGISP